MNENTNQPTTATSPTNRVTEVLLIARTEPQQINQLVDRLYRCYRGIKVSEETTLSIAVMHDDHLTRLLDSELEEALDTTVSLSVSNKLKAIGRQLIEDLAALGVVIDNQSIVDAMEEEEL